MTHRTSLILGLVAALAAALPETVHGTEHSALRWQSRSQVVNEVRFQAPAVADAGSLPGEHREKPARLDAIIAAPEEADATETTQAGRPDEAPRADDQIQLVARMFQEVEDELPPAPGADPMPRRRNGPAGGSPKYYDGYDYCDDVYCPPPAPPLFWVAGVEATFLSPDLNGIGAWTEIEVEEWDRHDVFSTHGDRVDSLYVAPRIWLGVQGCAWGANVRYWHLRAGDGTHFPSVDPFDDWNWGLVPNAGLFTNARLDAYTVDVELTRRFCLHDWQMQASAGVRHGSLQHHESIVTNAIADDARLFGYGRQDRWSRGTGIVLGLYGRKPLFPCSCVHWFYNVRGSVLWGKTETAVETMASVMTLDGGATSTNGAWTNVNDDMFIGEVQVGLEWNYALKCLPANAFFRAAIEYQRWNGGKGYSEASSFAGVTEDDWFTGISTFASADGPRMDLFGFTLGTGLTW